MTRSVSPRFWLARIRPVVVAVMAAVMGLFAVEGVEVVGASLPG